MANITLTIAGIYYSSLITVPDPDIAAGFTVLQLMELARRQTELLFQLEGGAQPLENRSMAIIQNRLLAGVTSRSGKVRQPGFYAIEEQFATERTEAWQYYIERPGTEAGFVNLVSKTVGTSFKTPGKSEPLQDGDTVIWRCVSILIEPTDRLIV